MQLKSFTYKEFEGEPREWTLTGLVLGSINLLVGKNASGKTRALNTINGLAKLLSGESRSTFKSGSWDVTFERREKPPCRYVLVFQDSLVVQEEFFDGDANLLSRGRGGVGTIYMEQKGESVSFQTPETELAAVARRDSIQHGYLESLYEWGESAFYMPFGRFPGSIIGPASQKGQPNGIEGRDFRRVVDAFKRGAEEFGRQFEDSIISDMKSIGYDLKEIGLRPLVLPTSSAGSSLEFAVLYVRENGLQCPVEQTQMSDGMFHALSLVIYFNYFEMISMPSCIIIDDIGEGLDFDRSCGLVELLRRKASRSSVQLVMATNDRFVMNHVPLEEWSLLHRRAGHVHVFNYQNSRERFDEFKFSGLNNFDFFATDFISEKSHSR